MRISIPAYVGRVLEELHKGAHEAYVVGGCVRDSLLGREPADWMSPPPLCRRRPWRCSPKRGSGCLKTGLKHGTVTVISDGRPVEVTTYRWTGIIPTTGTRMRIRFTRCLAEDLCRRDFTINAMAYNPKEGLVDAFEGIQDLKGKTDPLRGQCSGALYRGCLADSAGDPFFSPAWIFHRGKHLGGHQGDCSEPDPREQGADSGGVNEASVI